MNLINLKYAYLLAVFMMGIALVLSFIEENIAYSQLTQSFAMSYFLALLIIHRRCKHIFGPKLEIVILGFMVISTVSLSTKFSLDLFNTMIWGPITCFSGVLICATFVDTTETLPEIINNESPKISYAWA